MVCYTGVAPRLNHDGNVFVCLFVFLFFSVPCLNNFGFSETGNSLLLNHSLFLCNNYDHWINSCYCFYVGSIVLLQYLLTALMPFSCFDS